LGKRKIIVDHIQIDCIQCLHCIIKRPASINQLSKNFCHVDCRGNRRGKHRNNKLGARLAIEHSEDRR